MSNESDKSYSHAQSKFNTNESTSFQDFVRILWSNTELFNADIHVKRANGLFGVQPI